MTDALATAVLERIATEADRYARRRVPYRHQGRGVHGVDCVGLCIVAARAAGLSIDESLPHYGPVPNPRQLQRELIRRCDRVAFDELARGHFLCFHWGNREPAHFGVWLGGNRFAHALAAVGRVCVQPLDARWLDQVHSCWVLRGAG